MIEIVVMLVGHFTISVKETIEGVVILLQGHSITVGGWHEDLWVLHLRLNI